MKIFKRMLISAVLLNLTLIILLVSIFVYQDQFAKKEVYRKSSPNGEYVFVLHQVGQPGFPFGPVKAQISVQDPKGKTIDKESIWVHTDGGQLDELYIKALRWRPDMLEVVCIGEDGRSSYVLEFD